MEQMKRNRLREKRIEALRDRFHLLKRAAASFRRDAPGKFFPDDRDFASCEEVRAIIDVDADLAIDGASFESLRPLVPDIVARWRKENTSLLQDYICAKHGIKDVHDALSLAFCLALVCRSCNTILSYPNILSHSCYSRTENVGDGDFYLGDYECCADMLMYSTVWGLSNVDTLPELTDIITACGKDFTQVTQHEMDKRNTMLVCETCTQPGIRGLMTWRAAVGIIYEFMSIEMAHLLPPG